MQPYCDGLGLCSIIPLSDGLGLCSIIPLSDGLGLCSIIPLSDGLGLCSITSVAEGDGGAVDPGWLQAARRMAPQGRTPPKRHSFDSIVRASRPPW